MKATWDHLGLFSIEGLGVLSVSLERQSSSLPECGPRYPPKDGLRVVRNAWHCPSLGMLYGIHLLRTTPVIRISILCHLEIEREYPARDPSDFGFSMDWHMRIDLPDVSFR